VRRIVVPHEVIQEPVPQPQEDGPQVQGRLHPRQVARVYAASAEESGARRRRIRFFVARVDRRSQRSTQTTRMRVGGRLACSDDRVPIRASKPSRRRSASARTPSSSASRASLCCLRRGVRCSSEAHVLWARSEPRISCRRVEPGRQGGTEFVRRIVDPRQVARVYAASAEESGARRRRGRRGGRSRPR
jgi:hypothetical protein